MQIVPKLPIVSVRRRTDPVVIQETPILAFLGLGLFLWIFLTNSLPAKRDLAHRLAQVEVHAGDQGRLSLLREELNREESLAEAVRTDSVVRRTLFLYEHPTAKPNDPDLLLLPMSFEFFPDDPDPIVEEWDLEGSIPATELPPPNAPDREVPATETEPRRGHTVSHSNAGGSIPRTAPANLAPTTQQPQKPKSATPRPPSKAETRPAAGRPATSPPIVPKKPSTPGRFEVPNFLQG